MSSGTRWAPYLEFLPKHFEQMPMFWSSEDLLLLNGTSLSGKLHMALDVYKDIAFKLPEAPVQV